MLVEFVYKNDTLIDNLNSIFEGFEKHNDAVINKITEQYEALKSDVIVRVEKAETTANEALLLYRFLYSHILIQDQ